MFRPFSILCLLAAFCLLPACRYVSFLRPTVAAERADELRAELAPHLNVLGARNWIVIADPAYPILAGEGVDVLTLDADTPGTLREVLKMLAEDASLTPRLWLCSELEVVPEKRAPGIRRFRNSINKLISRHLHYEVTDRIIALQLTQAAQTYRILYIKTTTALPYSAVAIELDSGYWDSDDEAELRERMEKFSAPATPRELPRLDSSHYSREN